MGDTVWVLLLTLASVAAILVASAQTRWPDWGYRSFAIGVVGLDALILWRIT